MKRNNKIISLLIFFILVPLFIYIITIARTPAKQHRGVQNIRVGVAPDNSIYTYRTQSGNLAGYNIDIINAIALEMGFDVDFLEIGPKEVMISLIQNKVDCAIGIEFEHIPTEYILKSRPFLNNKLSSFSIKPMDISDTIGSGIAVCINIQDPNYNYIIKKLPNNTKIVFADNVNIALELLANGLADFYIGDKYITEKHIQNTKYEKTVYDTNFSENNRTTTLISLTDKENIVDTFNSGIKEIKAKGTLSTIIQKWFGNGVLNGQRVINMIFIMLFIALLILVIVFIFARINLLLKKQVEERTMMIKKEKLLNESIIDSLFEGLIFMDYNFVIVSANPAACRILNTSSSLVGKKLHNVEQCKIFKQEDFTYVSQDKVKIVNHEAEIIYDEFKKTIEYVVTPVLNETKKIMGINLTFRDITEEKNIKQKSIAKDKLETVGRLTAGIAHEIRNPLTSISMYIKLLPSKIDNESFRNQLLEDIPKEIARLDDIISNLLDYAKPSPPQREKFNLKTQLEMIMRFLDNQLLLNGIGFNARVIDDIYILFDPNQFKQIIFNIIINSIDALKEMPMHHQKSILVNAYSLEEYIRIEISDNGKGISKELNEKIFEPFSSTKEHGYGLGLSIVRQLVDENFSEIYYDTKYENGAKFILDIPKGDCL